MDILHYTYYDNSNQLKKVLDTGNKTYGFKDSNNAYTEYTYDANGNMKTDLNKEGIVTNINYNHLNLPTHVVIGGKNIDYVYDAAGVKLRKIVSGIITDYAGNFIYENNTLQFLNHAEGYVKVHTGKIQLNEGIYKYVYQYKDHLGNVRLSYTTLIMTGILHKVKL